MLEYRRTIYPEENLLQCHNASILSRKQSKTRIELFKRYRTTKAALFYCSPLPVATQVNRMEWKYCCSSTVRSESYKSSNIRCCPGNKPLLFTQHHQTAITHCCQTKRLAETTKLLFSSLGEKRLWIEGKRLRRWGFQKLTPTVNKKKLDSFHT